jgi:hypothetical protein
MQLTIDRHLLGSVLLGGQCLDLLGGLYLAYELFGGPRGPLRRLTHFISYLIGTMVVTVVGYLALEVVVITADQHTTNLLGGSTLLGNFLGRGIGAGIGGAVGFALFSRWHTRAVSYRILKGCVIGAISGMLLTAEDEALLHASGLSPSFSEMVILGMLTSLLTGGAFGALVSRFLMRRDNPSKVDFAPPFDKSGMATGLVVGYAIGCVHGVGYWLVFRGAIGGAVFHSLVGGSDAAVGIALFIANVNKVEWHINHLPALALGRLGALLVFVGFIVQSLQYIVQIFDIAIR